MNISIKTIIQTIKNKDLSFLKSGNMWYIRVTVILLIIPIVEVISLQTFMILFNSNSDRLFKLIDYGLKIIDHIYAVPVITGILYLASRLVDSNNDDISDVDEKQENPLKNIPKIP